MEGQDRRKGEAHGRRLSPGERAKHWAQAAVTAWPIVLPLLGVLGYTNSEHIRSWTGLAQADGQTEVVEGGVTFESQVSTFSREVRAELETIHDEIKKVNSRLAAKDRENYERLEKSLAGLKQQVDEIQELVN